MKFRLSLLAIFLLLAAPGYAQTPEQIEEMAPEQQAFTWKRLMFQEQQRADDLQDSIGKLHAAFADSLSRWSREIEQARILNATLQPKADSLARVQDVLSRQREKVDLLTARFCKIRLGQRYREKWQKEALEEWKTITSPSVLNMEEYKGIDRKLEAYPAYYREIRKILEEKNTPKELGFAHDAPQMFKKDLLQSLNASTYVREAYKKSEKNIPYLDFVLNHVFGQIEKDQFDFTSWLDLMLPEPK